ncbi:MAG: tRNA (N6-isopentenyl adenosine(37)-C2)-methylthiotransferase MiaB [Clostridiales bacterium]|nr:tRNA (N6-isopentenyl adenosine(37)-C2)-methylthiotransferase MiaB [Clostridiales bacterium]
MNSQIKLDINSDDVLENQYYISDIRKINDDYFMTHGIKMKFHVITYGCQMNEHDSEKMIAMLKNMGYEAVDAYKDADLIVFNTCAVRENAELRVFGNLGHVNHLKKTKKNLIVVVSGCMMQQPHIVKEIKEKYKFVDIVFGTHNVHNFPKLIKNVLQNQKQVIEVWDSEGHIIEGLPYERKLGLKAYVNIMFGCNNFCTYCIVPYTRGRERSREKEHILQEIKKLADDGVREITLLGQNVNSYGKTFDIPYNFADLLTDVSKIDGIKRIRFMTSHPKDLSDQLINVIAENKKVCEYVHLPIQTGSNSVLKRMNRKYTKENYMEIVNKLKDKIPNLTLSTDLIIGFPGETDADNDETIELIKEIEFDAAFTFIYSKREGTPAAKLEDSIPEDIQHLRFNKVLTVINNIIKEKNAKRLGNVYEVLVEGRANRDDSYLIGRSRENFLITFKGSDDLIGELVDVKITRPKNFSLEGEIINTPV